MRASISIGGLLLALLVPSVASAQAGIGSSLSGPVDGDGASPFWNPASMGWVDSTTVDFGSSLGFVRVNYDRAETDGSSSTSVVAPLPFAGFVSDLDSRRWHAGVSAGVPYAAGARWSPDDAEGEVTRYYANEGYLVHAIATAAASYQANDWLSVGAGVNLSYSRISADFDKDFAAPLNGSLGAGFDTGPFRAGDPRLAGPVEVRSHGVGLGGILGFAIQDGGVRFGSSVHTPINANTSGSVKAKYPEEMKQFVAGVAPGAQLPALEGDVGMTLKVPWSVFNALSVQLTPVWDMTVDYSFANTSSITSYDVLISSSTSSSLADTTVVKGTRDRHRAGVRVRRTFAEGKGIGALHGRFENNTIDEMANVPNNADFHKIEIGAGGQWRLSSRMRISAFFTHYIILDRVIEQSLHQPNTIAALAAYNHPDPTGRYSAAADKLTVMVGLDY